MKLETKMSQKALERKSNKPIMEKKRRARINHCLNQLKALILETDNERSRHSKLEKADILEMTVRYLQTLRTYHLHLQQLQQLSSANSSPQPQPQIHSPQHHHHHHQHQHQLASLYSHLNNHQLDLTTQTPQMAQMGQLQLKSPTLQHHMSPQSQISPTWRPW